MEMTPAKSRSIARTFHGALLLIYLCSVLAVVPVIYLVTRDELYAQTDKELKVLVDVVSSARNIVREKTRPYFMAKEEFLPIVVSSTVMAKELAAHFHKLQPAYLVRMISDNPLNRLNMPQGLEVDVLENLRKGGSDKGIIQTGAIDGRNYLISAVPTRAQEECLLCHGDPSTAPKGIVASYGTASGFGWKPGAIIGASLVGVPVADLNAAVLKRSMIVIGIVTVLFAIVLIVLNRVVENNIIKPILQVTEAAKAISLGRSNAPLVSTRNDEIGAMTRAFELMRRSINIAAEQIARQNKTRKE
jgi:methyl-accepting chemotaxis protein